MALPLLIFGVMLMTLVTKFSSPGPVFFRQERTGYKGQRFQIWKFRTMSVAADTTVHQQHFKQLVDSNAPMVKLDDRRDARLIPGGWLLRASGIDELPQVFNVLRGEMSIVGPRPCLPNEFVEYSPAQRERFNVVPGLTGLWQVSGKNRTTFKKMIQLDIHYARHVSVLLNLKIILLTPKAILTQLWDSHFRRNFLSPPPADSAGNQRLGSQIMGTPAA